MKNAKLIAALVAMTALAGCLSPDGERAVAGAAIGATVAAATGGSLGGGAAVGAAAGALCDDVRLCPRR